MLKRKNLRGVTLIELLVVISIIAMLAGMLGLAVPAVGKRMLIDRAKADMQKITMVLEAYKQDCGQYPDAINHNPSRVDAQIPPLPKQTGDVTESQATYPCTHSPTKNRNLYYSFSDEGDPKERTQFVWSLSSWRLGWGNPQFFEYFSQKNLNSRGALIDPWGRRWFYLPAEAYIMGKSGTKGDSGFINPDTYQVYSAGPDGITPADKTNRAGTQEDDIRNW